MSRVYLSMRYTGTINETFRLILCTTKSPFFTRHDKFIFCTVHTNCHFSTNYSRSFSPLSFHGKLFLLRRFAARTRASPQKSKHVVDLPPLHQMFNWILHRLNMYKRHSYGIEVKIQKRAIYTFVPQVQTHLLI